MIEEIFPEDIGRQFNRRLLGGDTVLKNRNGFAFFVSNQPPGTLRTFSYPRNLLSNTDYDTFQSFFIVSQAQEDGFLYKDWKDFEAINTYIGTGDGSTTSFDLIKRYTVGTFNTDRRIFYPKNDTLDAVYFDSVSQPTGWSFNTTTKKIDFTAAPALDVVITADYEFYIPAKFTDAFESVHNYLQVSDATINISEIVINV